MSLSKTLSASLGIGKHRQDTVAATEQAETNNKLNRPSQINATIKKQNSNITKNQNNQSAQTNISTATKKASIIKRLTTKINSTDDQRPVERLSQGEFTVLSLKRGKIASRLILISSAILLLKAFYLQIINTEDLRGKGEERYLREIKSPALRGRILDRNNSPLAVSTPMYAIWAAPDQTQSLTTEQKRQLADLLAIKTSELQKKLNSEADFVYLQRKVSPENTELINKMQLSGIHSQQESRRYYPSGELAAHIIGSTDSDNKGIGGAELIFDSLLQGQAGHRVVIKDRRGKSVEDMVEAVASLPGQDVLMSLDTNLQYIAYTQLKQAVDASNAKAGSAIVVDSQSGEILALVNFPSYDPNSRSNVPSDHKRNRAVTDSFEPGSTIKPLPIALALELGRVRPESTFQSFHGKYELDGVAISDDHDKGTLSVRQIIEKSSNVGSAQISLKLSSRELWSLFEQLGFGRIPNIGFPNETTGILRPWQQWRKIERATMSYGHGMAVSLIQLVQAYMPFAREGDIVNLSLLKNNGKTPESSTVFRKETVSLMREMLESVTGDQGTAPRARVNGYRVGGKTGTAYKVENGHYVKKYISSFVGIAPISKPRLIAAVMIDEPNAGTHYGGDIAAPVFSALIGASLRNLGIPQDGKISPTNVAQ